MAITLKPQDDGAIEIADDNPANPRWARVRRKTDKSFRGKPLVVWVLVTDSGWGDQFERRNRALEEGSGYVRNGQKGSWNDPFSDAG